MRCNNYLIIDNPGHRGTQKVSQSKGRGPESGDEREGGGAVSVAGLGQGGGQAGAVGGDQDRGGPRPLQDQGEDGEREGWGEGEVGSRTHQYEGHQEEGEACGMAAAP